MPIHRMIANAVLGIAGVLLILLAATSHAHAAEPTKFWTTVGSAGTLNEADLKKVVFSGGTVAFPELLQPFPLAQAPAAAQAAGPMLPLETTQAVIRYNVTAVDGLFAPGGHTCLQTRFRDDGDRARVFLRLIEYNLFTGVTTTRLTFDSNTITPQANYQVNSAITTWTAFDFSQSAYYVEAVLTKQAPVLTPFFGGNPGLGVIQIGRCTIIT
jgi:hypothetical protein